MLAVLLTICFWPFTRAATKIRANQINLTDVFAFSGANTHAASETFNATINTNSVVPNSTGFQLGTSGNPWQFLNIGNVSGQTTQLAASSTSGRTDTLPDATGTVSLSAIEYCGATSGATQACAKTVQTLPIIVWGEVTLNTATTQSITTLPFTDALYSCEGTDLTTAAGNVSFNTYASASVTIQENGGVNTDHLRWLCVGH